MTLHPAFNETSVFILMLISCSLAQVKGFIGVINKCQIKVSSITMIKFASRLDLAFTIQSFKMEQIKIPPAPRKSHLMLYTFSTFSETFLHLFQQKMSMFQHNPFLSTKFCILIHFKVHTYSVSTNKSDFLRKESLIVLPKCKKGKKAEKGVKRIISKH